MTSCSHSTETRVNLLKVDDFNMKLYDIIGCRFLKNDEIDNCRNENKSSCIKEETRVLEHYSG